MLPNPQFPADLVTFTEEILNGKRHFLCIDSLSWMFDRVILNTYLVLVSFLLTKNNLLEDYYFFLLGELFASLFCKIKSRAPQTNHVTNTINVQKFFEHS